MKKRKYLNCSDCIFNDPDRRFCKALSCYIPNCSFGGVISLVHPLCPFLKGNVNELSD